MSYLISTYETERSETEKFFHNNGAVFAKKAKNDGTGVVYVVKFSSDADVTKFIEKFPRASVTAAEDFDPRDTNDVFPDIEPSQPKWDELRAKLSAIPPQVWALVAFSLLAILILVF